MTKTVNPEHKASAARMLQEPYYQYLKASRFKFVLDALMTAETDADRLRVQADHQAAEDFFRRIESAAKVRANDE